MKDIRIQIVEKCGDCPYMWYDATDYTFRCGRNTMEPQVDPFGLGFGELHVCHLHKPEYAMEMVKEIREEEGKG